MKKTDKSLYLYYSKLNFLCITGFFILTSCVHEFPDPQNASPVCFNTEVLPVFQNSCGTAGCHDAGTREDGIELTSYAAILKTVVPFDAAGSKSYRSITGRWEMMPPGGPLSRDARTKIWLWIEQGALETLCTPEDTLHPGTPGVSYACFSRDILPVLQNSCAMVQCHDNLTHKEGINLTSYQNLMNSNIIKAGKPGDSDLYEVISLSPQDEDIMPPKPYAPLTQAVRDSIYNWILRGAKNEICATVCDTTGIITWANQVSKVITTYCISCHSGASPSGGILLFSYNDVVTVTNSGKLLSSVKRQNGAIAMPPAIPLSTCDIRKIEIWKNNSYPQ